MKTISAIRFDKNESQFLRRNHFVPRLVAICDSSRGKKTLTYIKRDASVDIIKYTENPLTWTRKPSRLHLVFFSFLAKNKLSAISLFYKMDI